MRLGPIAATFAVFTAGCSLIDLSSLQDPVGSGGSTPTGSTTTSVVSGANTSTSGSMSQASSTTTTGASASSGSTSTGGCTSDFCGSMPNAVACADFDSAAHTLGGGWNSTVEVFGGTTGSITISGADSVSCPSSAVVDVAGVPGGNSNVRVSNSLSTSGHQHIHYTGKVKRSGPGADGTVLDVGWDIGGGQFCDIFVQLFDGGTPFTYVFLQHWDGSTATTVSQGNVDLPANTANTWVDVSLDIDFTPASPTITPSINGMSFPFALSNPCKSLPATLGAGWGVTYSDVTETMTLDDLTVSAN